MITQAIFTIPTPGRGLVDITDKVKQFVLNANVQTGLCHLFIHHTSASLLIGENYDPLVQKDLETFMLRLVPDGDKDFEHTEEGPDDMPSHVRSMLTTTFLVIPITDSALALGRWQGIFLWEHRLKGNERKITITID